MTLNADSGLTTVDLGMFDTTDFSDGSDTITVTVTDLSSQPLPSVTGVGSVTIGAPVTASLTVSPTELPTGGGTVTNTLQINRFIPMLIYSLAEPLSPQLLSDTSDFPDPLNGTDYYTGFLNDMVVQGNTVLVPTTSYVFFGGFEASEGNVLAIDVSNPSAPQLEGVLFPGDDNLNALTNQFGATIVNSQIAYIARSTSNGGNTQDGVGRVLVVDYSDPTNPIDLGEVDIPGTYQVLAVAVQGDQALVVSRAGGDGGPDQNGSVTLSVLDITDPTNPQLVGTTLLTNAEFPTNATGVTAISAQRGGQHYGAQFIIGQLLDPFDNVLCRPGDLSLPNATLEAIEVAVKAVNPSTRVLRE